MLISVFVKGLIIGFMIAAPVGPINVLCVRRTIVQGRVVGFVSGMGAACADTLFGAVAAFGLVFIHALLMGERFWLGVAGGAVLIVIGVRTLLAPPPQARDVAEQKLNLIGDFTSTFLLTLTNPVTIMSFLAAFTLFGVQDGGGADEPDSWLLLAGVFAGATAWWLLLTMGVGLFQHRFDANGLRWANRVAGILILAFAGFVLWEVAPWRWPG